MSFAHAIRPGPHAFVRSSLPAGDRGSTLHLMATKPGSSLLSRAVGSLTSVGLLALLAFVGAGTANAAPSWLEPVDLGQPDHPSWYDNAMTPEGEVLAIWRGGTTDNYVVRSVERPVGGPLGSPRELVAAGDVVEYLNLDLNANGDAIAVWRRRDGDWLRLQYSVREPGGEFSLGQFGSPTLANVAQPQVALEDDGDAIAVWRRAPNDDGFLRYAFRPAGGQFGAVGSVAAEGGSDPQVAVDGAGNATAVWVATGTPVIRTSVRPSGGSFSAPTTLSGAVSTFADPALAVNSDGAAAVAWREADAGGDERIEVALREPGGAFQAAQQVSPGGVDSGIPHVELNDQGEVLVAWRNETAETIDVAAGSLAVGIGVPQTLSGPDALGHSLAMTDEGHAAVAWSQGANPVQRAYASVRPPGGDFGAAAAVSNSEGQALFPLIALDSEGNGVAVWNHKTEPGVFASERIRLAGYDAVAPRFTGLTFPAGGPVGRRLPFSASTFDVWGPVTTSWAFGDKGTTTGDFVRHRYRRHGSYRARATATDAAGNAVTGTAVIRAVDRAVRILILGRGVRVNRRGIARLRLRCPKAERSPPCAGRVLVRTARRFRAGAKRRRIVLGRARFRVAAGRTRAVRLRLGRRKAALVRRNRRARRAVAIARVRDRSRNRSTARKRMRVVPARRGGR